MHHHDDRGYYVPGMGYPPAYWQQPPAVNPPGMQPAAPAKDDDNRRFVKGVLLGAAATYLLTNERVQHTLFRAVARVWTGMRFGMEEVRERYQDAQAEVESERHG